MNLNTDISQNGLATVTLNRPKVHNAFDEVLIESIQETFENLCHNANVRVIVLMANGQSFCAGADLNWMRRMSTYTHDENVADGRALAKMLNTIATCPKPVIGQIQGPAYGGGVGIVAVCDIAVAAESAMFSLSEVKLGLTPATISPYVIGAMGERQAQRYFITAERFNAATALKMGLVHKVVPDNTLEESVFEFVIKLLKNSPSAIAECKKLISAVANRPIDDRILEDTAQRIAEIRASLEGKEGIAAFLEKRRPKWS
ncbi:MAG: enoyl-CoA hydratase [Rhodospirillaceae bacterium TMED8]|nr:enoyl-CoA hydratase [Magnetovibrio sp.]OUT49611.1 MAG: enoyl-CoA hydratase [Rhodospirillaceae bacterium TMED8]